ncbi:phage tail protein I [Vibrio azureus]|uniref:Putative phage tail protein n=1 Tax=Vibrio azureus NBRC 104587 TaxID=1219077 RepID=U3AME7_9VIBR|nr:phage tail protein I [Vibrio azureus]AUI88161.1 phage tail protein I [Vibrio azureus]GAD74945.1 putative phage tail protein [Vibrio azureus NBRC 104587]
MSELNKAFISVQPNNASLIEEALEYGWAQLLHSLPCPYPNLKQPLLTAPPFVALLAGERGVRDWQPKDTPQSQRKTVDKAFEIHRKAGTRLGLSIALDAIDCDVDVIPWHQMTPRAPPYHIECIATQRSQALDKAATTRVLSRIESTKSERDTVHLIMALSVDSGFTLSAVTHPIVMVSDESALLCALPDISPGVAPLYWGAATRLIFTTEHQFGAIA